MLRHFEDALEESDSEESSDDEVMANDGNQTKMDIGGINFDGGDVSEDENNSGDDDLG